MYIFFNSFILYPSAIVPISICSCMSSLINQSRFSYNTFVYSSIVSSHRSAVNFCLHLILFSFVVVGGFGSNVHFVMFKETFKYYKTKSPTPDFSCVVDLDKGAPPEDRLVNLSNTDDLPPGLQPIHTWRCHTLSRTGLIVIRNPFTPQGQRYWLARCLQNYPRHPNVTNLNTKLFSQQVLDDWWRELQNNKNSDEVRRIRLAMRWTTLGYHHDWDTKVYTDDKRGEFPADLAKLTEFFANALGFENFEAQAAIVNYYPLGTTLSAHTDHSEPNLTAPLFSLSFGQTAIFLIGSESKETIPTAIFLKSGDVLIMSGGSRLCYHAVPRVMKAHEEPWNQLIAKEKENLVAPPNCKKPRIENVASSTHWAMDMALFEQVTDEMYWLPFKNYLNNSRVNINVRQVLNAGENHLPTRKLPTINNAADKINGHPNKTEINKT